jgi:hypothetical protein
MTAANLAKAARYGSWSGVNLRYGLSQSGLVPPCKKDSNPTLLAEFAAPKSVTNEQWVLVMWPGICPQPQARRMD